MARLSFSESHPEPERAWSPTLRRRSEGEAKRPDLAGRRERGLEEK